ncbi:MAG: hypothetical protein A3D31_08180 [Candidatus Fluviicola riflensis]|nr:MAG: hypothetical protein CHH17_06825 [Candidatus Fluviicola riflensis]OGS79917.1 MAG: hypothetical protein A3D31_08180 [Candidatus Fluviicola riflensis]OGS82432.1 MAG: hypothetical protein A2724_17125 [Fluviicola sp. RIFCSPHIGHO2_01_FULL_43_53]OGS88096.1 MAG: hypothetical protein A3E30_14560 [Fluviicola sp. RIFCSPHIGHO2_12_FULL_43_24]
MPDRKNTEEQKNAFADVLTKVGGPVQGIVHDALQKSSIGIVQQAEEILEEDLNDLIKQNSLEEKVRSENSLIGKGFRGASWLFMYSNNKELFNYELESADQWESTDRFDQIRNIHIVDENTVRILDNNVITVSRNVAHARIDQTIMTTILWPLFAVHFHAQGTWVINNRAVCYVSTNNRIRREFNHSLPIPGPIPGATRRQFLLADHLRNILFIVDNNKLWKFKIHPNSLANHFEPIRISGQEHIHTFKQFTHFNDVQYSEKLGIIYLIPETAKAIYAYHPHINSSLRIGKKTPVIKVPAPIRPYRDFSLQCMIRLNRLGNQKEYSLLGGAGMPAVFIRPKDAALIFRWYDPGSTHTEPLIDLTFPKAFENCVGKWITLTISIDSKKLNIYCNGKSFEHPLTDMYPTCWDMKPSDLYIGTIPDLPPSAHQIQSPDFCIAELRVWNIALERNEGKKAITSWIVSGKDGFPEGLHQYYRFDKALVASFQFKQEKFDYHLGTELVRKLQKVDDLESADWSHIEPPSFYEDLIKVAESSRKMRSGLCFCETSQQIFWGEDKTIRTSEIYGASALGVEQLEVIGTIPDTATILRSKWQGFTHIQYLRYAKAQQQNEIESGNDLVHAARMQTYLELTWMHQENERRISHAKRFRKNDTTINQHAKKQKRFLEIHDSKRKTQATEHLRVTEKISKARMEALEKIRNARSEAIRRR